MTEEELKAGESILEQLNDHRKCIEILGLEAKLLGGQVKKLRAKLEKLEVRAVEEVVKDTLSKKDL